ncbi:hypothetical protein BFJ69_g7846 [Fusarium oxysporum]|uniref:Cytochrome-b5 reductase n=1 Tax=Fusarium oxysporum TaxID=5507 RepID=A0A420N4R2_FUSOX|nr:hypothetical protein BFJ69_g7846 [Fusarium oxysporum]
MFLKLPLRYARASAKPVVTSLVAGGIGFACFSTTAFAESPAPAQLFPGGLALKSLPVDSVEAVNHNTKKLRFKLPNETDVSGLPLTGEAGFLELLVKGYPKGKASSYMHSLKPGDSLFFVAALKGYPWKANSYQHIVLIGGGAGITPLYQLTQGILKNPNDNTIIKLIYGIHSEEDILLRKELEQLASAHPDRFKAVFTLSKPVGGSSYHEGRIDKNLLQQEAAPSTTGVDAKVFICGPPSLEEALVGDKKRAGILEEIGYRKDQIYRF